MTNASPHLFDIDGEMTPNGVAKALLETGRVDGMNELFILILATVICERKHWQTTAGGEHRVLERHLDAAVDWLESKCREYQ